MYLLSAIYGKLSPAIKRVIKFLLALGLEVHALIISASLTSYFVQLVLYIATPTETLFPRFVHWLFRIEQKFLTAPFFLVQKLYFVKNIVSYKQMLFYVTMCILCTCGLDLIHIFEAISNGCDGTVTSVPAENEFVTSDLSSSGQADKTTPKQKETLHLEVALCITFGLFLYVIMPNIVEIGRAHV